MTPDAIASLVNFGSAGAVIIVVVIFLRSMKERDALWREFFTDLNSTNKNDVCKLAEAMERMIKALDDHDARAKEIKATVDAISRVVRRRASDEPKTSDRQYLPKD
jgi:hypothetical protein